MVTKLHRLRQMQRDPYRALFDFIEQTREELAQKTSQLEALEAHITSIEQGKEGYSPIKGVDYFTPEELREMIAFIQKNIRAPKDGQPGKDGKDGKAPSAKEIRALIKAELVQLPKEAPMTPTIITKVTERVQEEIDFASKAKDIARAIEGLKGSDRLDYRALKNLPGVPAYDDKPATIHRGGGGGAQTYYYDLSHLTDGVTKTFTIPANARVVWVGGSDAPSGQYRKDTDWTGSGTTTLTLTSEVAAPSQGATLHILYVE